MIRTLVSALLLATTAGAVEIDPAKVVDLTYPFGAETIYWPTAKRFALETVQEGDTPGGYWYEANNYAAAEHGGTHMDAPVHFARGGATADQVPATAGIGPLVRVDVSAQAATDADYRLSRADLVAWEQAHGRIPKGAIVVMYSGWGARWPDKLRYLDPGQRLLILSIRVLFGLFLLIALTFTLVPPPPKAAAAPAAAPAAVAAPCVAGAPATAAAGEEKTASGNGQPTAATRADAPATGVATVASAASAAAALQAPKASTPSASGKK